MFRCATWIRIMRQKNPKDASEKSDNYCAQMETYRTILVSKKTPRIYLQLKINNGKKDLE